MELPQGLESGTSLSSISNLNPGTKSTYVCAHKKTFHIYHLHGYIEKHKVLYMSIELLCCNFKITTCPIDSHSNYLVKWTFLSFYNVVTLPTSLVLMKKLRKLPNLVDWYSVGNLKMKSDAGNSCRSASSVRKSRSLRSGLVATDTPTNAEKTSTITQTSFAMSTGTQSKSQRSWWWCCCWCITTGRPSRVKSQQQTSSHSHSATRACIQLLCAREGVAHERQVQGCILAFRAPIFI
jgi:hypothetical protein